MWRLPLSLWQRITTPPETLAVERRRSFEIMAEIYLLALVLQILIAPLLYLTDEPIVGHLNLVCLVAYVGALWLHRRLYFATALACKLGSFLILVVYASLASESGGSIIYYLLFAEIELMLSGLRPRTKVAGTLGLIAVTLTVVHTQRVLLPPAEFPLLDVLMSEVGLAAVFLMICMVILRMLAITDRHEHRHRRDAMHDGLTLVFNRRAIFERASSLWQQSAPFSLVLVDADRFKEVNDAYGHTAGDAVLRHLAAALKETLRRDDAVGRVGGEEFLALLPGASRAQALEITQRIRDRLAQEACCFDGQMLPVTLSMGIAQSTDAQSLHALIELADRRLYAAKSGGRDRVIADGEFQSAASRNAVRLSSGVKTALCERSIKAGSIAANAGTPTDSPPFGRT
ncbi:GGDEF domain-containing protein [Salinicola aestuarinus]|uniref:GGDEF domain-containing protein n=1 Tax=Salinicola aestuarinus TaxID=1949082 RepID=UPI000DA207F5|nr:GGDEF domain-containing protein [Salinicola aestuarinus]